MTDKSNVTLEPSESLSFTLVPNTAPQAVLTIKVTGKGVAFKVKTTRPMRYLVRPNQGIIGSNGSASIVVILQQKDCDELRRLDVSERALTNDKFLVQSTVVDDDFCSLLENKSSKEISEELTKLWNTVDKKNLVNKKLRCSFVEGDSQNEAIERPSRAQSVPTTVPVDPLSEQTGELVSLRKKYDELVAFTVQLTSQRDEIMNQLDRTKAKLEKVKSEGEQDNASSEFGLRQRRQGASTSTPESTTQSTASIDANQGAQLTIFHLLLCCLIFFMLGKFYATTE